MLSACPPSRNQYARAQSPRRREQVCTPAAIGDITFTFARKLDGIAAEAALDGIYIIRTSGSAAQMDAPQCVHNREDWTG